jgi:hypothetical protein
MKMEAAIMRAHHPRPEYTDLQLSLAVAQGEFARYCRTGELIHLAHATRALVEAQSSLGEVRQRALARAITKENGGV